MTLFNDDGSPSPMARSSDPFTSHAAAADVLPRVRGDRETALRVLGRHSEGLTDFELATLTRKAQTSIGKRRKELVDMGFAEAVAGVDGRPATRPAPSGSAAIVWTLTPAGVELLDSLLTTKEM